MSLYADALLFIALALLALSLLYQPSKCIVAITGHDVVITGCQNPERILEHLNLAPWNGVKFPSLSD